MRNLKTASKITVLVTILFIFLCIIAGVGYNSNKVLFKNMERVYKENSLAEYWLSRLRLDLRYVEVAALRNMQERGDTLNGLQARMMGSAKERLAEIEDIVRAYLKTNQDDKEKAMWGALEPMRLELMRHLEQVLALATADKDDEAHALYNEKVVPLAVRYYDGLTQLGDYLRERSDRVMDESAASARRGAMLMITSLLSAALLGCIISFLIIRSITVPLRKLNESVGAFARGKLTVSFDTHGKDEIALMGLALEEMRASLLNVISLV